MKLPPLLKSTTPRASFVLTGECNVYPCDLGPNWWTDNRLLVNLDEVKGCKKVTDRMRSELTAARSLIPPCHTSQALGRVEEQANLRGVLVGYEPITHARQYRYGYIVDSRGRAQAFLGDLLNVFMRTSPEIIAVGDKGTIGLKASKIVALIMPISVPEQPEGAEVTVDYLRLFFDRGSSSFGCGS